MSETEGGKQRITVNEPEPAQDDTGPTLTRKRLIQTGAAAGLAVASAGALGRAGEALAAPVPKRGGRFRVGMLGGGDTETLKPIQGGNNEIDVARAVQIYERLVTYDLHGAPVNQLAAGFSHSRDLKIWKIKIVSD